MNNLISSSYAASDRTSQELPRWELPDALQLPDRTAHYSLNPFPASRERRRLVNEREIMSTTRAWLCAISRLTTAADARKEAGTMPVFNAKTSKVPKWGLSSEHLDCRSGDLEVWSWSIGIRLGPNHREGVTVVLALCINPSDDKRGRRFRAAILMV